jgi:hypothetical protein
MKVQMLRTLYICILFAVPLFPRAQTVSGSWFGRADVEMAGIHNNYLTELVIKQKGTRVEGIFGYYFRDKYESFFIHGHYDPKTREITILNIPVIYYNSNSTVNSIDCITNFHGTLIHSRVSTSLTGYFFHDEKYKYMCPDLKVSYTLDRNDHEQDSALTVDASATKIWKPQADDVVVEEVKAPAVPRPGLSDSASVAVPPVASLPDSSAALAATHRDSTKVSAPPPPDSAAMAVAAAAQKRTADSLKIVESYTKRKAVLNRELLVESDSVRLSFYDNGEIDGDSISVFVNNQLVLSHQGLEAKAFNIYLHLDSTRELNEVSMFAENLGKLPPNTALMVVTDGKNRYEVFLSSSLTENATVELRRKPKTP